MSREWDPNKMGFGKHDFRSIDPSTINPEDFARRLHGEETAFGDVRQYNSAYNEKHPLNDVDLDWLSRIGTEFETDAPGLEGVWRVSNLPVVHTPTVYIRCTRFVEDGPLSANEEEREVSAVDLGCQQGADNLFKQIKTKLMGKGHVTREQRERLTKKK